MTIQEFSSKMTEWFKSTSHHPAHIQNPDNPPKARRTAILRWLLQSLTARMLQAGEWSPESLSGFFDANGDCAQIPDECLKNGKDGLFDILDTCAFALAESSDSDVITPNYLADIFEQLLPFCDDDADLRRNSGSYYTPKHVVDEMAQSALCETLCEKCPDIDQNAITALCRQTESSPKLDDAQRAQLSTALEQITVFDPACGCGAFPVGLLHLLTQVYSILTPDKSQYEIKRHILSHNLYGADIEPIAVEITRLRLTLSLLCDAPSKTEIQIPELTFRFVCADTTLKLPESAPSKDLFASRANAIAAQITALRRESPLSPQDRDAKDNALRAELGSADICANPAQKLAAQWNPYQLTTPASFFDPLWMFGLKPDDHGTSFDIVIGNPPYGVRISDENKLIYKKIYKCLEKKYDIYMVFFERGFELCRNVLCYITPDKWLSKSFALKFREQILVPYISRVMRLGNDVFSGALVDAIISQFNRHKPQKLGIYQYSIANGIHQINEISKSILCAPYLIDPFFSDSSELFQRLDRMPYKLGEFGRCEYASASPKDAYTLRDLIRSGTPVLHDDDFAVINTGTIGKYISKWGTKPMKYLKKSFEYPVVPKSVIKTTFGKSFYARMRSPKVIIKGLNLLDACTDLHGSMMSTVATLIIRSHSIPMLNIFALILNSQLITDYIKSKYISSSYCGGLEFTPDMINLIPVPNLKEICEDPIRMIEIDSLMYSRDNDIKTTRLEQIVRNLYHLPSELAS